IEYKYVNEIPAYVSVLFGKSLMTDSLKMKKFLKNFSRGDSKKIVKDPVYELAISIFSRLEKDINPALSKFNIQIDSLQRIYMDGQMQMQRNKLFYPDANSSLRISYGKIDDYEPADGVHYNYFTTSQGILQKEDSTVYDYAVDSKLKSLFQRKDFGRYADRDGTLHIAFTGSNHTTGGNSGSPVLDANGYLIGINFDRNWEGTMSDLIYDPSQCRNITLDIRYCLFIIDKYAGSKRLISEMKIVE
ncbi:MAG TPA: S46 family peptidase, partial [Bacteroidales bacterium]|nr:S46 family peptidase [Bacteroidales bacterium]